MWCESDCGGRRGSREGGRQARREGEERHRENMNLRKIHREVYLGGGTWRKEKKGK